MLVHLFACLKMSSLSPKRLKERVLFDSSLSALSELDSESQSSLTESKHARPCPLRAAYWSHRARCSLCSSSAASVHARLRVSRAKGAKERASRRGRAEERSRRRCSPEATGSLRPPDDLDGHLDVTLHNEQGRSGADDHAGGKGSRRLRRVGQGHGGELRPPPEEHAQSTA